MLQNFDHFRSSVGPYKECLIVSVCSACLQSLLVLSKVVKLNYTELHIDRNKKTDIFHGVEDAKILFTILCGYDID